MAENLEIKDSGVEPERKMLTIKLKIGRQEWSDYFRFLARVFAACSKHTEIIESIDISELTPPKIIMKVEKEPKTESQSKEE